MSGSLDPEVLKEIRELGDEMLKDLIDLFISTTPERVEVIRKALAAGDGMGAGRAAHFIEGSCGVLGATAMITICKKIEELAEAGQLEPAAAELARLEREYLSVCGLLAQERSHLS